MILPIYHKAPKKHHDLLCQDLSTHPELIEIDISDIDSYIREI